MTGIIKMNLFRAKKIKSTWIILLLNILWGAYVGARLHEGATASARITNYIIGGNLLILTSIYALNFFNGKYNVDFIKNVFAKKRVFHVLGDLAFICIYVLLMMVSSSISVLIAYKIANPQGAWIDEGGAFAVLLMCQFFFHVVYLCFMDVCVLIIKNSMFSTVALLIYTLMGSIFLWSYLDSLWKFPISKVIVSQFIFKGTAAAGLLPSLILLMIYGCAGTLCLKNRDI